ncbi:hypothetical protein ABW21_db0202513 [Orbilia brochopaga]|nr:hypothetical protein ABW21_db0202513 [Drechslerella brochopaga]
MRLAVYGTVSTLVASGVVLQAFHQRANFYSACVHLAQSNACLMILTNFGFFMTLMFGKMVQKIFYGPLRPAEVEDLYEKAWYAITETFLAMTIFRDEFRGEFVAMFTIQQTPPDRPVLFHIRLASSLAILLVLDFLLTRYSILTLMQLPKPNMLVMFAFDFAILTINCSSVITRYLISVYEKVAVNRMSQSIRERKKKVLQARLERGQITEEEMAQSLADDAEALDLCTWEAKSAWTFRANITSDVLKLLIYVAFFSIVLTFYGLPLHIIRDVYLTIRSFITKVRDYIAYKKATADMNSKYPDANAAEIGREPLCIICRETMVAWSEAPTADGRTAQVFVDDEGNIVDERMRPKKLPCGHVLHLMCLKSWMERQQRCPTCRRPVLDDPRHAQRNLPGPNIRMPPAAGAMPAVANGVPAAQPQPPAGAPVVPVPGPQGPAQAGPAHVPGPALPGHALPGHALPGHAPPGQPILAFPNHVQRLNLGPLPHGVQIQHPALGPNGMPLNGGGGFLGALARNAAQREQVQQAQRAAAALQNPDPRQRHAQLVHLHQAGHMNLQHDLQGQMNGNTAAIAQAAVQGVVQQQHLWNQRIMQQMNLMMEEIRALRANAPAPATSNAGGPAGADGSTAGTSSVSGGGGTPPQAERVSSQGPSPTPTTPLRSEVRSPPSSEAPSTQPQPPLLPALSPSPPAGPGSSSSNANGGAVPGSNSHGGAVPGSNNLHAQAPASLLPPGFQLPPGWSVVPLYPVAQSSAGGSRTFATPQHIPGTTVYTTPSPAQQQQQHQLPHLHLHPHHSLHLHQPPSTTGTGSPSTHISPPPDTSPAAVPDINLSTSGIRRRGVHRQYSSTLHAYHSMTSPRREEQNPLAGSMGPPPSPGQLSTASGTAAGPTSPLASPPTTAETANLQSYVPPAGSPSRHGSISATSREVLERRHREAHSPRDASAFSPPGSRGQESPTSGIHQDYIPHQPGSAFVGSLTGSMTSAGMTPHPTLDTSAEHNHPIDPTHNPTSGRSPAEERRRASAGEILLSETDTVWPGAPPIFPPGSSGAVSEASTSPNRSLTSSRAGSIRRRNRGVSNAGMTVPPGSGSPVGTTGMFNVIPRSQTGSNVGSPTIGHSTAALSRLDIGSPSRMSLDPEKAKDDGAPGGSDDAERGRSRSKEPEGEK